MRKKSKQRFTRNRILEAIENNRDQISRYGVRKIGLFGSFAKGSQHRKSDLDFVVEFESPSFDNFMNLINYLEKLFGKKVDVITPAGIDSIRVKSVAKDIRRSVIYV